MAAVDEHLVRRADGVILLLTPPFGDTPLEPGYIKGMCPASERMAGSIRMRHLVGDRLRGARSRG